MFASCCYSGHGAFGLTGPHNTNFQTFLSEARAKAWLWDAYVSGILIWLMTSFIHSFTHSTETFRVPNICKTRQKPKRYKPEWDLKLGFHEFIFCPSGMVGKPWNLWAGGPWLEGCLFHLGAVWFWVVYQIFLSLSFLICKTGINHIQFQRGCIEVIMLGKLLWKL